MNRQTLLKKKLLVTLITTAIASTGFMPSIVWSQSADATLRGKAPAKASVTAKNIATGSVRRTNAGDDGSYTIVGLQPGTYQVDAGPGTEQTVTLTVASTASLDIGGPAVTSTATTTLEGVVVTAQTLTEVKTSEVGGTISQRQIQTIPQITRNFLEFADTIPGVAFSVDQNGNTTLRGGGQNTGGINVYVDGVGQKNYVKDQGGASGQFFSQGNPFPQLAIGEYKVITSNYKAEYDQVSSAAVTAETKSGTNDFHGEVFNTFTDDGLRSKTPSELAAGKQVPSQEKEYGVALGGPIIQDTLHFFFTYEAKRFDTPGSVIPGVANIGGIDVRSLLPADAVAELGPTNIPFAEDLYFGKIDWEFSDRDRVEVSAKV
ncbi:MAG: carboxypeptidase-like regulatory domain-containing protein, partial [Dokdonella sp.]|uniref:TonB-dependent receptor n=1 Tax=Dokdonella sp. TaxID=2291710 RepID=UPI003264E092